MNKHYKQIFDYNTYNYNFLYSSDNSIELYNWGDDKFQSLIDDIKLATHSIHIQYYIIRNDSLWKLISELLVKKASQGVTVRILYDGMASLGLHYFKKNTFKNHNVHRYPFYRAGILNLYKKINNRNHRKLVVIDGIIAYLGGFNIGLEYLGLDHHFGEWRDTHIRLCGSSVNSLQLRFTKDWYIACGEELNEKSLFPPPIRLDNIGCQIITSAPYNINCVIRDNFIALISLAQKTIYIETPYFIPDDLLFDALIKAKNRGVTIKVIIPESPDHAFVYWASTYYMGKLMRYGIHFYVYNKGFLHSKFIVVDDIICTIGSANFDIRSFKLNYETNALIYSERTSKQLSIAFFDDIRHSTIVTSYVYNNRPNAVKRLENFCKILSPFM